MVAYLLQQLLKVQADELGRLDREHVRTITLLRGGDHRWRDKSFTLRVLGVRQIGRARDELDRPGGILRTN